LRLARLDETAAFGDVEGYPKILAVQGHPFDLRGIKVGERTRAFTAASKPRHADEREAPAGQWTRESTGGRIGRMARQLMGTEKILFILRQTPDRLTELTAGATESQLHAAPEPGEWSVVEVLAHLRSCADVWGDAIEKIVVTDHPTIRAVNPTTWIESTDYRELEFAPSQRAFTDQRVRLLALLGRLPNEGWSRSATVLGAGKPLELTVQSYADRLARHERAHWSQMTNTVRALAG
jgi:hypothetical protein